MAPDINSLPTFPSSPHRSDNLASDRAQSHSPSSPRPASLSIATAAASSISNAEGMQQPESRRSSTSSFTRQRNPSQATASTSTAVGTPSSPRRISAMGMRINLNEPALPGSGELLHSADRRSPPERRSPQAFRASPQLMGSPDARTADPHHQRTPSLGELHQELEQEQEAHVMIRQQQIQLQQLQAIQAGNGNASSSSAVETTETPSSERSLTFTSSLPQPQPSSARTRSPAAPNARSPRQVSRQNSYRSQHSNRDYSPGLRPVHAAPSSTTAVAPAASQASTGSGTEEVFRDESIFYQAETQTLTRENHMLKVRIRELEKMLADAKGAVLGEPFGSSNLAESTETPGAGEGQPSQY